jgi:hypothetical protein
VEKGQSGNFLGLKVMAVIASLWLKIWQPTLELHKLENRNCIKVSVPF